MMNGFYVKDGIVTRHVQGHEDNRATLYLAALATAQDGGEPLGKRVVAANKAWALEQPVEDWGVFVEADTAAWPEAVIGEPLGWPRTRRNALMDATQYVESPGWRADKASKVLKAWDAYRSALRDLPESQPDALSIIWPGRPDAEAA